VKTLTSAKGAGRVIGALFLIQMVLATPVYIVMLRPVTAVGFLATAAGNAFQVRLAVLLSLGLGALTLAIAIVGLPVFRRYSERMAVTFLALSIINLSTLAIESIALRNLLALSLEYARAGGAERLEMLGGLAHSTWYMAHHTNVTVAHAAVFVFNWILFRYALVPRTHAALGMGATLLSTMAVGLPLLGFQFVLLLIVPTGLTQLALVFWLLARGFQERPVPGEPA
jgi:hypothetical protein